MRIEHERIESVLNIYKRYNRMNARIKDKSNVTKTLSNVSNFGVEGFLESISKIESFSENIKLLTESSGETVKALFNHKRKGSSFKTDQNFYFLWTLLNDTSNEAIKQKPSEIFHDVSEIFGVLQNTPEKYSTEQFMVDRENLIKKYSSK